VRRRTNRLLFDTPNGAGELPRRTRMASNILFGDREECEDQPVTR